jgi:hypothetical protein
MSGLITVIAIVAQVIAGIVMFLSVIGIVACVIANKGENKDDDGI